MLQPYKPLSAKFQKVYHCYLSVFEGFTPSHIFTRLAFKEQQKGRIQVFRRGRRLNKP